MQLLQLFDSAELEAGIRRLEAFNHQHRVASECDAAGSVSVIQKPMYNM